MNIIIDRPQLVRVVLLYLNMNFGNLTPKTNSQYPNSVFYVDSDNEIMMEYDKKNEYVWIHYEQIWSKIESLFSLNHSETQSIMKIWLEEAYNLRNLKRIGVRPSFRYVGGGLQFEEFKTISSNLEGLVGWRRLTI